MRTDRLARVLRTAFALGCALWAGCALPPPEKPPVVPLVTLAPESDRYPRFTDDLDFDGLEQGIQRSLDFLGRVPAERDFTLGSATVSAAQLRAGLTRFRDFMASRPSAESLNAFIRQHYLVLQANGESGDGQVLFTGYYEPVLRGSLRPDPRYPHPIYGLPEGLISVDLSAFRSEWKGTRISGRLEGSRLVPYHTRAQIDTGGALEGLETPLAWAADPVDLFFLHIQGSGRLQLDDGEARFLQYAGQNGHPYFAIGRHLIEIGAVPAEAMSMQRIRAWLADHPGLAAGVMNRNDSYVFFRLSTDPPTGSLGVPVTAGRTLALDHRVFPSAALAYVETVKPLAAATDGATGWVPFQRFMLNQDTGGAIRGPGRADFYWGGGDYAQAAAGHMKHTGKLYFLILKPGA